MMNALIALGLGIIIFALIAGVGVVILQNFSAATGCTTVGGGTATYNVTDQLCYNSSGGTASPSTAALNVNTTMGYITSNLITWIPAVIALGVGLLFIGNLMGKKTNF